MKFKNEQQVEVVVHGWVAGAVYASGYSVVYYYDISASGQIKLTVEGQPFGDWGVIPKIGLQMALPASYDHVAWYGRGPRETYPDSREAGKIEQHRALVDELFTPYVFPQDTGNHVETRWVSVTNARGIGLMASSPELFNFGALHYSTEALEQAKHTNELVREDVTYLNLDYKVLGLGSASCGPKTTEELFAEDFKFTMVLIPFDQNHKRPETLYRGI